MQILRKYTARVFILKGESMKKSLLILALLCAPLTWAQDPYPLSTSRGGNITSTNAACVPSACVGIGLSSSFSAVITVGVTGTYSATLAIEESQDGGTTWTSAGTSLTSTGTTSYVIAGFTNFRVRASAYVSGNAGVNLQVSNAPSGGVTSGTADPTGNACAPNALYVLTTNGALYTCKAGVFALLSGGSTGTVTSIATTGPISGGTITTTGTISCPTCTTSAAALTNNAVVLGAGSQGEQTVAGVTTDGVSQLNLGVNGTVAGFLNLLGATSGNQTISTNATGTQVLFKPGATLALPGSSSGTFTMAPNSTGSQLSLSGSINVGGIAASGAVAAGGFSAVGTGAPVEVYNTTQGGQTASIGATTMLANPATDRNFLFHVYIGQTAAGTTCTIAGSVGVNVVYTDAITSAVYTYVVPLDLSGGTALGANIPLSTTTPTVANVGSGVFRLRAKASTNVQVSTTYAQGTCSSGSPSYFFAPVLEAL